VSDDFKMPTKEVRAARVQIVDSRGHITIDGTKGPTSITFDKSNPSHLRIYTENEITIVPADDVISVALLMQAKKMTASRDVETISHQDLLDGLLHHIENNDGSVQVLEGAADAVKLESFSMNSVEGICNCIHFIEANSLQETAPWAMVWNLYQCMIVAAQK
jgi:hypothetical protein